MMNSITFHAMYAPDCWLLEFLFLPLKNLFFLEINDTAFQLKMRFMNLESNSVECDGNQLVKIGSKIP